MCSDAGSWINSFIPQLLLNWTAEGHEVRWAHDAVALPEGDVCFYLSYGRIVGTNLLARHTNNLVVHASDLPKGRGWSPLTWQILEGKDRMPVTLFEAAEKVDSGSIYKQTYVSFSGIELIDELRSAIARANIDLCRFFVKEYPIVVKKGVSQKGEPTFYARRSPKDSFIDLDRPLREQFNLLRTVDNRNYPAWFTFKGKKFIIQIKSQNIP